jgi:hypothetical protein
MRSRWIAVFALLGACGADRPPLDEPRAKPEAPPRVAVRAPVQEDLALAISGPSSIAPAATGTPLALVVRNESQDAIAIEEAHVYAAVHRGARPLRRCNGTRAQPIDLPAVLAPGASVVAHVPLECAIPREGEYTVVTTLVVGRGEGEGTAAPTDIRASASMPLSVDPALAIEPAPPGATAEIYPPDPADVPITRPENVPHPRRR